MACVAKLLVLDGFSLAFRAFFALPETMITASGQYTNAIYGFTSMLLNLVKEHHPTHIAVAFDHPDPTFRDKLSADYKGNRKKTPESLMPQLSLIGHVVESLGIPIVESAGYEADDVIATLAEAARERGWSTIVVTGDRDNFQVVSDPNVKVLYNRRGVSDYELLDSNGVKNRMGVKPELYPQMAALRGDPSDNIPGVPGIGEKTAAKLINEYGSVEEVLRNADALSPKLRELLGQYHDQVLLNVKLTVLDKDVPLDHSLDDLELGPWDPKPTEELFRFLEFKRIWDRTVEVFGHRAISNGSSAIASAVPGEGLRICVCATVDEAIERLRHLAHDARKLYMEVSWCGTAGRSKPESIAVSSLELQEGSTVVVAPSSLLWLEDAEPRVFGEIANACESVSGFGLKEVLRYVYQTYRLLFPIGIDGTVAGYLLDPTAPDYELDSLAGKWLEGAVGDQLVKRPDRRVSLDLGDEIDSGAIANRVDVGTQTVLAISTAMGDASLDGLYEKIEKPLIAVLAKMEALGILVDRKYLSDLQKEFAAEALDLQQQIQDMAGLAFNVNSTQQLGKVLFERLGLPPQKRTKTGYSTDARSLEKLVGMNPIVEKILRYREVEKLRSTYGEGLIAEIADDGRIHATFSQTVARTGRLSSDHPNLHNIPIRTEDGRRFRNAFVAPEGRRLVIADYSQIELRVIAHLSRDPGLIEAFAKGIDIHRQTASYTFGVPLDQVTPSQRNKAKMVAYGLAYGMEAYGLSQRLGISVPEAEEILGSFFAAFPSLSSYMKETVAKARRDGYTTTEFGRIRPLPELSSRNHRLREAAERQAMNAGIQGLAADIFKIALVKLDRELSAYDSDIVLQVHDEVLVECAAEEVKDIESLVRRVLEGAVELSVPLEVNVSSGTSWADGK